MVLGAEDVVNAVNMPGGLRDLDKALNIVPNKVLNTALNITLNKALNKLSSLNE